jgi:2,5-diketo-D-gluconate reductase B
MDHVVARPPSGTELRLPAIGFGTWPLRGQDCRAAVADALSVGYRHLDTARMYRNEAEVGAGLRDSGVDRDEVLLVTKVRPGDADRDGVRREVDASLRELGLDHVDLLLLHAPASVPIEETMGAFREQQEAGKVRHIGVSNFGVPGLERAAAEAPIACVQNEYRPGLDQASVLSWCREHTVAYVAYSPLDVGRLARRTLAEIGERHDRSWAQVTLRWLLQQEQVATIPRSRDEDHRAQNLAVFDFELDADEMARISALR